MGYLVNPVGFRVGFTRTWQDYWFADSMYYADFVYSLFFIRLYLKYFFTKKYFFRTGFVYSHVSLYKSYNNVDIHLYFYDFYLQKFLQQIEKFLYNLSRSKPAHIEYTGSFDAFFLKMRHINFKFQKFRGFIGFFLHNDVAIPKASGFIPDIKTHFLWGPYTKTNSNPAITLKHWSGYKMLHGKVAGNFSNIFMYKRQFYTLLKFWRKRRGFILKLFVIIIYFMGANFKKMSALTFYLQFFWRIMLRKDKGWYSLLLHVKNIYSSYAPYEIVRNFSESVMILFNFFNFFNKFWDSVTKDPLMFGEDIYYTELLHRLVISCYWYIFYEGPFKIFKTYLNYSLSLVSWVRHRFFFYLLNNDCVNADFILDYVSKNLSRGFTLRGTINPLKRELDFLGGFSPEDEHARIQSLMRLEFSLFKKIETPALVKHYKNRRQSTLPKLAKIETFLTLHKNKNAPFVNPYFTGGPHFFAKNAADFKREPLAEDALNYFGKVPKRYQLAYFKKKNNYFFYT